MSVNLAAPESKSFGSRRVFVKSGLEGQDDNIDLLEKYFIEMQKSTVETSTPSDFLSFAACAHYFGVVMFEEDENLDDCGDEDAEGEPEEDSEAVAESIYPDSSTATSPPASTSGSNFSVVDPEREGFDDLSEEPYAAFSSLSEQDKILKWREAFVAEIEEGDGEPMVPPLQPINLVLGEEEAELYFGKAKGKPSEDSSYLIPHVHNTTNTESPPNMDEDPECFINWPDDMAVDDTLTIHDVYDSTSNKMDTSGPPQVAETEKQPEKTGAKEDATAVTPFPEIRTEPELQAMVYDAAIKFRDGLRARRIAEYERKKAGQARQGSRSPPQFVKAGTSLPATFTPKSEQAQPIGLVYLWTSQTFEDPLHIGEYSLGFYIAPEHRRNKHLTDALNGTVKQAFEDKQCHRLQSILVENDDKLYALELLTACGFRHEGTRRRAFFSQVAQEWRDVTYFAMLATEWVYDSDNTSSVRLRTASLWEEILARHQRECDDLHRLEEKNVDLRRSNSVETIKQQGNNDSIDIGFHNTFSGSQYATSAQSFTFVSSLPGPSAVVKRKKLVLGAVAQARQWQRSSSSQGKSEVFEESQKSPVRNRYETRIPSSSSSSPSSPSSSPKRSHAKRSIGGLSFISSSSSASDLSSQWDLLDDDIRNSGPSF